MMAIQGLDKRALIQNSRWPQCPYMVKNNSGDFFSIYGKNNSDDFFSRMVLGKLPVPERPTNLDKSRACAYCACSRCGWGLFGHFFSHLSFLFSFSLSLGDGPI